MDEEEWREVREGNEGGMKAETAARVAERKAGFPSFKCFSPGMN